ncbi:glycosyltransferase family 87 protein [Arthrobacter sp. RT-1]|uniref:glycosyltransferase family 87 protein n=1 Tax=Arthrobacter sp. RT-1 TaxID=2292263 RepID=UPI0015F1442B|nr:glycosyltransferase family 87 protein [Arthrobacter sp. RT-1]
MSKEEFATTFPVFMKGALFLTWLLGAFMVGHKTWLVVSTGWYGWDAHAYWLAARGDLSYSRPGGEIDAYLYSPAFATVIRPIALLDWQIFFVFWVILQASVLVWLLMPLKMRWSVPLFLASVPELINGNIFILLAACAVLGLTRPRVYCIALLTKITAAVGLLWFAGRRQWAQLIKSLSMAAIVAFTSYLLSPGEWQTWLRFLLGHRDETPDGFAGLVIRCLVATAVVLFGARTGWAWLIAPAMVIASPIFDLPVLTLLTAIPRLSMFPFTDIASKNEKGASR